MSLQIETRHILIWLLFMGFLSRDERTQRLELVDGTWSWRSKPLFAVLMFLPIFLMAVYSRVRGDMGLYIRIFRAVPSFSPEALNYIISSEEPGFAFYNVFIKSVFGDNETAFRLFIALIHSIPVVAVLRKYSEDYAYSVFMFVALATHISWMMNGMRQFMAAMIIFAATPWMVSKKILGPIFSVLFATLFHRTAIIMLPIFFVARGEIWNGKTILYAILIVAATFLFAQNSNMFDNMAESIGYSLSYVRQNGDDGTNPIRVLVHALPMILSFVYRKKIMQDNIPVINICVNMSVITTGLYLVSMVTSGIMVGRLPIYTSLYNFVLMPYILHNCFPDKEKKSVFLGSILMYIVLLYIEAGGI